MTRILIVSKTRMGTTGSERCIGGLTDAMQNVRLLTAKGGKQPEDTLFEIGQVWNIDFEMVEDTKPPHTEDIRVISSSYEKTLSSAELLEVLKHEACRLFDRSPTDLFDGHIRFKNRTLFISDESVPNYSTGFWKTDTLTRHVERWDGKRKDYYITSNGSFSLRYVGLQSPLEVIPANTLLRVSLARWWKPSDKPQEERKCHVQLSGWYL